MTYPTETGRIILALGYDFDEAYASVATDGTISVIWTNPDPEPSVEQFNRWAQDLDSLPSGQYFSDWDAENGGDALRTAQRQSSEQLANDGDTLRAGLQAMLYYLLDHTSAAIWTNGMKPDKSQAWRAVQNAIDQILREQTLDIEYLFDAKVTGDAPVLTVQADPSADKNTPVFVVKVGETVVHEIKP